MSEGTTEAEHGPEVIGARVEPAAVSLALVGASREEADAFLRDQRAMLHLQMEEMQAEEPYKLSHLRLRRFSGWAKALFELSVGFFVLALVTGLGVMVWNAAHSETLIIEALTVPPDMAARGLSGQALASQMLDKLTRMQNVTAPARPAKTYANDWGSDLKVEIPSTGISFGEAWRFLRGWLGHETRISGEVWRTASGIAVIVRTSGGTGATFTAPEADLDTLIQKAAEQVYGDTQPFGYASFLYRYGVLLGMPRRSPEAEAIFLRQTTNPDPQERAWAWAGLGSLYNQRGKFRTATAYFRNGIAAYPGLATLHTRLANSENNVGHDQAMLEALLAARPLLHRASVPDMAPEAVANLRIFTDSLIAYLSADYAEAEKQARLGADQDDRMRRLAAVALASQHDRAAMLAYLAAMPRANAKQDAIGRLLDRLWADFALKDWQRIAATEPGVEKEFIQFSGVTDPAGYTDYFNRAIRSWHALARAGLGDMAGAEKLIAATQGDCHPCLRARAQIASAASQWGRADYWFARAVAQAPSLSPAHEEWGRSLLARGQPDEAIAQFQIAGQKSPYFADPLEGWGEALMAKNQSHMAVEKFAKAEKYAPNWGRLHLKWGEALAYSGKKDEAAKQFARAAALDLTPSEKIELTKMSRN